MLNFFDNYRVYFFLLCLGVAGFVGGISILIDIENIFFISVIILSSIIIVLINTNGHKRLQFKDWLFYPSILLGSYYWQLFFNFFTLLYIAPALLIWFLVFRKLNLLFVVGINLFPLMYILGVIFNIIPFPNIPGPVTNDLLFELIASFSITNAVLVIIASFWSAYSWTIRSIVCIQGLCILFISLLFFAAYGGGLI